MRLLVFVLVLGFVSTALGQETPRQAPVGVIETGARTFSSFEFLSDDGSDVSDFFVGDVFFTNKDAVVAAAATRGVPAGYRSGCFVWLTAFGSSTLIVGSDDPNQISFWVKDIAEVIPNVDGMLVVTYQDGSVEVLEVPNKYTRFNLSNVSSIDVVTNGITNIDDFSYIRK